MITCSQMLQQFTFVICCIGTLGGTLIDLLDLETIRMYVNHLDNIINTSFYNFSLQEDLKNKSIIVLTARVHPGETPSSWIMRGILHFITGSSEFANELRQRFIFVHNCLSPSSARSRARCRDCHSCSSNARPRLRR